MIRGKGEEGRGKGVFLAEMHAETAIVEITLSLPLPKIGKSLYGSWWVVFSILYSIYGSDIKGQNCNYATTTLIVVPLLLPFEEA